MKEKFIKSVFILLIGGFFTKILGMIIKIVLSRLIGTEGLGIYMMVLPTFSLFIGLAQFGMPIALSKLIAEGKRSSKQLISSILPISFLINIFLIISIILLAPIISNNLLKDSRTYYAILAISFVIPFTSISSLCRSYFFGKELMGPHVLSNLVEDVVRLISLIIGVPFFLSYGLEFAVFFVVFVNVISEIFSIIILIFFLPKNSFINKSDFVFKKNYLYDALAIGIPNTAGRLIGSIGYFLEPIILTNILIYVGYSTDFITFEYGILSGYVLPIILLPSFFTFAISQALLPVVTKEYSKGNYLVVKKRINQSIFLSLLIGIPVTVLFVIVPELFLNLVYNTSLGVSYLRILAPIALFQYIQAPLMFSLEAIGKSKQAMYATLYGIITRLILLTCFSLLRIGLWGLVIATSFSILASTVYSYIQIRRNINNIIV